jgi:hypothetical protein
MSSVTNMNDKCPICGNLSLFSDLNCRTGDEIQSCALCGYYMTAVTALDESGRVRLSPDNRKFYNIEERFPIGLSCITYRDNTGEVGHCDVLSYDFDDFERVYADFLESLKSNEVLPDLCWFTKWNSELGKLQFLHCGKDVDLENLGYLDKNSVERNI